MPTPNDQDEWITIDEAVELSGKSRATLWRWVKEGKVRQHTEKLPIPLMQKRIYLLLSDIIPPDRDAV